MAQRQPLPDFPTVAGLIADLYPQSGGRRLDGVVIVDPLGLGSLLELTGPVHVPGRAEPLTADNMMDFTLREAYETENEPVKFLGTAARRVFETTTTADLGEPPALLVALGDAARRRHLLMWSARPDEQRFLEAAGASHDVPPPVGTRSGW